MNIKPLFLELPDELRNGRIYYSLFNEILEVNGYYENDIQDTILCIHPKAKRINTLGIYNPNEDTIYIYMSSIFWDAVKNNYVEDDERIGEEFADTVLHEFRHSMQHKDSTLPQTNAKAYHNPDGTLNEKYWNDAGEVDARRFAKFGVTFMKHNHKHILKKLGRYVRFYCYSTRMSFMVTTS